MSVWLKSGKLLLVTGMKKHWTTSGTLHSHISQISTIIMFFQTVRELSRRGTKFFFSVHASWMVTFQLRNYVLHPWVLRLLVKVKSQFACHMCEYIHKFNIKIYRMKSKRNSRGKCNLLNKLKKCSISKRFTMISRWNMKNKKCKDYCIQMC